MQLHGLQGFMAYMIHTFGTKVLKCNNSMLYTVFTISRKLVIRFDKHQQYNFIFHTPLSLVSDFFRSLNNHKQ